MSGISTDTFRAFAGEMNKTAFIQHLPGTPKEKAIAAGGVLAGAGLLAGGKRIIDDVRMGEQMRQQRYY